MRGLEHRLQQTAIEIDIVDDQDGGDLVGILQHTLPPRDVHVGTQHHRFDIGGFVLGCDWHVLVETRTNVRL